MFGVGHYIYAGEDIPNEQDQDRIENEKLKADVKVPSIDELIALGIKNGISEAQICAKYNEEIKPKISITSIKELPTANVVGFYKLISKKKDV